MIYHSKILRVGIYQFQYIMSINTYIEEVTYFIFTYIFDRCQINESFCEKTKKKLYLFIAKKKKRDEKCYKISQAPIYQEKRIYLRNISHLSNLI